MANGDRLTALDTSFLHLEEGGRTHMHVGSVLVFAGEPPSYDELAEHVEARLHLVPRYRQRLAHVPLGQGRPVWVDDPHFNLAYHLRHAALPEPGGDAELKRLAARLFSVELDRAKPLWELYLVEGLGGPEPRFAVLAKTHHALVDGISGVDIVTVLFDASATTSAPPLPEEPWVPRPEPTSAQLLADALLERATVPGEIGRGVRRLLRGPRQVAARLARDAGALAALARGGIEPAPRLPFNRRIGPHRRFTWVRAELARFKAVKNALGGTVNDVVLTSVALALGRFLRERGVDTTGLTIRAMVPVSVRAEVERGALGNRVATMWAPLPLDEVDPATCFGVVHEAMAGLKESGQAVGAEVLTSLAGFAPPTILAQAARLQSRQRLFNLVVTNVPGPQAPLYLRGRRLEAIYPQVPLAENQGLGIAIMSYNGRLDFGLLADYDALPDVEELAAALADAILDLEVAAGVRSDPGGGARNGRRGARRTAGGAAAKA